MVRYLSHIINVIHTRTQFREKIRYFEKFPSLVLPRNKIITSLSIICSIICQVAQSLACSRLPVCGDDRESGQATKSGIREKKAENGPPVISPRPLSSTAIDGLASHPGESRNTPGRFMLQKHV